MNNHKILVTDDDATLQALYHATLGKIRHYDVDYAASAAECREMLLANRYDLALLDIELGQESGVELLTFIHHSAPHVRPIMMSSHDDPATIARCAGEGARGFVSKNRNFLSTLLKTVEQETDHSA